MSILREIPNPTLASTQTISVNTRALSWVTGNQENTVDQASKRNGPYCV